MLSRTQKTLYLLVISTTLPFFLILNQIDWSLFNSDSELFWLRLTAYLGSIFGLIGIVLLMWQLILGVRFFMKTFTPDLVGVTKVHMKIGKYGFLLILLHPILIAYSYLEDLFWILTPKLTTATEIFIGFGRIALILMILLYITSALIRGRIKYRPWQYIHYLSYPAIILVFLHSKMIGTLIGEMPILQVIWFGLFILLHLLLLIRLLGFAGILGEKYQIMSVKEAPNDQILLTILPLDKKVHIGIGQFIYVQMRNFGEAHPFTTMKYDEKTGEITVGFRKVGRFTKKLGSMKTGSLLNIDGPYGVFTKEGQNSTPKVILAGGIGITPFVRLIQEYGDQDTHLFYSVRNLNEALEKDLFKEKLDDKFKIYVSRGEEISEEAIRGRVSGEALKEKIGSGNLDKYRFFVCGSKEYLEGVKKTLQDLNIPDQKIFYEEFTL